MCAIQFVNNYSDLSTDRGFQFEFHCNRCGTGYRTNFQAWGVSNVSGALNAASSLLGGIFNQAADLGERVRSAGWQKAHDNAFEEAIEELRPQFIQCPRCSQWVCREHCWNKNRNLCKGCAPDLGVEMAAAQSSRAVEAVWTNATPSEEDQRAASTGWNQTIQAACPSCNEPLPNATVKFCPNCGAKIQRERHCTQCGAKIAPGAKFCSECGTPAA
jgi:membrane protease subunit (stomatin/prohibitin family)